MWTKVNQVYSTREAQNAWAHLAGTNKWHRILAGSADGVTNVHLLTSIGKAHDRQIYVVFDGQQNITGVYL